MWERENLGFGWHHEVKQPCSLDFLFEKIIHSCVGQLRQTLCSLQDGGSDAVTNLACLTPDMKWAKEKEFNKRTVWVCKPMLAVQNMKVGVLLLCWGWVLATESGARWRGEEVHEMSKKGRRKGNSSLQAVRLEGRLDSPPLGGEWVRGGTCVQTSRLLLASLVRA
ncbi:hypothetical protein MC885_003090 [Smutsia gigantea]|nr:hypothetical protein MC885_003090 [Smutsia gigantea]